MVAALVSARGVSPANDTSLQGANGIRAAVNGPEAVLTSQHERKRYLPEKNKTFVHNLFCVFFSKFGKRASFFRFLSPRVSGAFLILTRLFLSKLPYPTLRQRISLLHWN